MEPSSEGKNDNFTKDRKRSTCEDDTRDDQKDMALPTPQQPTEQPVVPERTTSLNASSPALKSMFGKSGPQYYHASHTDEDDNHHHNSCHNLVIQDHQVSFSESHKINVVHNCGDVAQDISPNPEATSLQKSWLMANRTAEFYSPTRSIDFNQRLSNNGLSDPLPGDVDDKVNVCKRQNPLKRLFARRKGKFHPLSNESRSIVPGIEGSPKTMVIVGKRNTREVIGHDSDWELDAWGHSLAPGEVTVVRESDNHNLELHNNNMTVINVKAEDSLNGTVFNRGKLTKDNVVVVQLPQEDFSTNQKRLEQQKEQTLTIASLSKQESAVCPTPDRNLQCLNHVSIMPQSCLNHADDSDSPHSDDIVENVYVNIASNCLPSFPSTSTSHSKSSIHEPQEGLAMGETEVDGREEDHSPIEDIYVNCATVEANPASAAGGGNLSVTCDHNSFVKSAGSLWRWDVSGERLMGRISDVSQAVYIPRTGVSQAVHIPGTDVSEAVLILGTDVSQVVRIPGTGVSQVVHIPRTGVSQVVHIPGTDVSGTDLTEMIQMSDSTRQDESMYCDVRRQPDAFSAGDQDPEVTRSRDGREHITTLDNVVQLSADTDVVQVSADTVVVQMSADTGVVQVSTDTGVVQMSADTGVVQVSTDTGVVQMSADTGVVQVSADTNMLHVSADTRVVQDAGEKLPLFTHNPDGQSVVSEKGLCYTHNSDGQSVVSEKGLCYTHNSDGQSVVSEKGLCYTHNPDGQSVVSEKGLCYTHNPDGQSVVSEKGLCYTHNSDGQSVVSEKGLCYTHNSDGQSVVSEKGLCYTHNSDGQSVVSEKGLCYTHNPDGQSVVSEKGLCYTHNSDGQSVVSEKGLCYTHNSDGQSVASRHHQAATTKQHPTRQQRSAQSSTNETTPTRYPPIKPKPALLKSTHCLNSSGLGTYSPSPQKYGEAMRGCRWQSAENQEVLAETSELQIDNDGDENCQYIGGGPLPESAPGEIVPTQELVVTKDVYGAIGHQWRHLETSKSGTITDGAILKKYQPQTLSGISDKALHNNSSVQIETRLTASDKQVDNAIKKNHAILKDNVIKKEDEEMLDDTLEYEDVIKQKMDKRYNDDLALVIDNIDSSTADVSHDTNNVYDEIHEETDKGKVSCLISKRFLFPWKRRGKKLHKGDQFKESNDSLTNDKIKSKIFKPEPADKTKHASKCDVCLILPTPIVSCDAHVGRDPQVERDQHVVPSDNCEHSQIWLRKFIESASPSAHETYHDIDNRTHLQINATLEKFTKHLRSDSGCHYEPINFFMGDRKETTEVRALCGNNQFSKAVVRSADSHGYEVPANCLAWIKGRARKGDEGELREETVPDTGGFITYIPNLKSPERKIDGQSPACQNFSTCSYVELQIENHAVHTHATSVDFDTHRHAIDVDFNIHSHATDVDFDIHSQASSVDSSAVENEDKVVTSSLVLKYSVLKNRATITEKFVNDRIHNTQMPVCENEARKDAYRGQVASDKCSPVEYLSQNQKRDMLSPVNAVLTTNSQDTGSLFSKPIVGTCTIPTDGVMMTVLELTTEDTSSRLYERQATYPGELATRCLDFKPNTHHRNPRQDVPGANDKLDPEMENLISAAVVVDKLDPEIENLISAAVVDDKLEPEIENLISAAVVDDKLEPEIENLSSAAVVDDKLEPEIENLGSAAVVDDKLEPEIENLSSAAVVDDKLELDIENLISAAVVDDKLEPEIENLISAAVVDDKLEPEIENLISAAVDDDKLEPEIENLSSAAVVDDKLEPEIENLGSAAVVDDKLEPEIENLSSAAVVVDTEESSEYDLLPVRTSRISQVNMLVWRPLAPGQPVPTLYKQVHKGQPVITNNKAEYAAPWEGRRLSSLAPQLQQQHANETAATVSQPRQHDHGNAATVNQPCGRGHLTAATVNQPCGRGHFTAATVNQPCGCGHFTAATVNQPCGYISSVGTDTVGPAEGLCRPWCCDGSVQDSGDRVSLPLSNPTAHPGSVYVNSRKNMFSGDSGQQKNERKRTFLSRIASLFHRKKKGFNHNGQEHSLSVDSNHNGRERSLSVDSNHNGHERSLSVDSNHNGHEQSLSVDSNRNGHEQSLSVDSNRNGHEQSLSVDSNRNGHEQSLSVDSNRNGYEQSLSVDSNRNGHEHSLSVDVTATISEIPYPSQDEIKVGNDHWTDKADVHSQVTSGGRSPHPGQSRYLETLNRLGGHEKAVTAEIVGKSGQTDGAGLTVEPVSDGITSHQLMVLHEDTT